MPRDRPLLIYDGACEFCRAWIARWRRWTGERVEYAASQDVASQFPAIDAARFRESVVLVGVDGRVCYAAEAVIRSLAGTPGGGALLWAYARLPGFAGVSEWAYRAVARRRGVLSRSAGTRR